jgi:hypothetical protein
MEEPVRASRDSGVIDTRKITSRRPTDEYPTNEIKSTSTNVITFIPLNLFHQLQNLANGIIMFI